MREKGELLSGPADSRIVTASMKMLHVKADGVLSADVLRYRERPRLDSQASRRRGTDEAM